MFDLLQRVKILFNKKDTALIQMAEPQQAIHAINHLDKVKLWGKAIRVMHSKHTNVQVLPLIVIFAQFFSFFLLSLVLDIFKYCYTRAVDPHSFFCEYGSSLTKLRCDFKVKTL